MTAPEELLWKLQRPGAAPIAVVAYTDAQQLQDLLETARGLASTEHVFMRAATVNEALSRNAVEAFVVLVPENEVDAIRELELRRDEALERRAPLLVCLLRDGGGFAALAEAFGLASVLRGHTADAATVDPERACREFAERHGRAPGDWLAAWARGELPDTLENNIALSEALLLEPRS